MPNAISFWLPGPWLLRQEPRLVVVALGEPGDAAQAGDAALVERPRPAMIQPQAMTRL
jgi:hypothetical protein